MKRNLVAVVSAVLLSLTTAAAAIAAAPTGEWHRLNPGDLNEHERLTCVESPGAWHCSLREGPGGPAGVELGLDDLACSADGRSRPPGSAPSWFPAPSATTSSRSTRVHRAYNPFDDRPFQVRAGLCGHRDRCDQAVLYQSWVDVFACPWFRTWDEALAGQIRAAPSPPDRREVRAGRGSGRTASPTLASRAPLARRTRPRAPRRPASTSGALPPSRAARRPDRVLRAPRRAASGRPATTGRSGP